MLGNRRLERRGHGEEREEARNPRIGREPLPLGRLRLRRNPRIIPGHAVGDCLEGLAHVLLELGHIREHRLSMGVGRRMDGGIGTGIFSSGH